MFLNSSVCKAGLLFLVTALYGMSAQASCYGFHIGNTNYQARFEVDVRNCTNVHHSRTVKICIKSSPNHPYYSSYCREIAVNNGHGIVQASMPNRYGINYYRIQFLDSNLNYQQISGANNVAFPGPLHSPGGGSSSSGGSSSGGNECPPRDIIQLPCNS